MSNLIHYKKMRRVAKFFLALAALVIVIFIWTAASILSYSSKHYEGRGDAAVVLGAAAWGNRPSPVFQARIDHAIHLYRTDRVNKIIFTGGSRRPNRPADSDVARNYAIKQGIPASDILIETHSHITEGNLRFSMEIAHRQGFTRLLIVSDPLHMKRSIFIARFMGMPAYPAPTPDTKYRGWKSKSGFLFRETYLYIGYILLRPFR